MHYRLTEIGIKKMKYAIVLTELEVAQLYANSKYSKEIGFNPFEMIWVRGGNLSEQRYHLMEVKRDTDGKWPAMADMIFQDLKRSKFLQNPAEMSNTMLLMLCAVIVQEKFESGDWDSVWPSSDGPDYMILERCC